MISLEEIKAECDKHRFSEGKKRGCDKSCKFYKGSLNCLIYEALLSQPFYWNLENLKEISK